MKRLATRSDLHARVTRLVRVSASALGALLLLSLLLLELSSTVQVAHAGKPVPPPPPPPPVHYRLTWLGTIGTSAYDINNLGTVVGKSTGVDGQDRAFRYSAGVMEDLNALVGAVWTNLGPGGDDGWVAQSANKINNLGQIVGRAMQFPSLNERLYLLTFPSGGAPQFKVLANATHVNGINDLGDVACSVNYSGNVWEQIVYTPWSEPPYQAQPLEIQGGFWGDINNAGNIVNSSGYSILPNNNNDYTSFSYSNRSFYGINESGLVTGSRSSYGTGKNKVNGGPIRLNLSTGVEILLQVGGGWGTDINEDGDVIFRGNNSRGFVYSNAHGLLALDSLVVNPDAGWQAGYIELRGMTDDDGTGFGQICGFCQAGAFLLTPEL